MSTPMTTPADPTPEPDETFDPASTEGLDDYLAAEGLDERGNPLGGAEDEGQQDEPEGAGRRGADARRRVELRETRAERDALREQVVGLQRAEVERLAAAHLQVPADLLTYGEVPLDDLLDKQGRADPEAVEQAVAGLLDARPGLRITPARPGGGVPSHGLGYTRSTTPMTAPSWADVIGNKG